MYWLFYYLYKLKEIKYTFFCHPFYLPEKSNAQYKFLKAYESFFKGEKEHFQKLKAVFIRRCLVQFMKEIVNLAFKLQSKGWHNL